MPVSELRIDMLGALRWRVGVSALPPPGERAAKLLALLALAPNQPVPGEVLLEEVLDGMRLASGPRQLRRHVAQLRAALSGAGLPADEVLVRAHGGYRLALDTRGTDVANFERLACLGEAALEAGDAITARRQLRAALDLWRGPALSGILCGPLLSCNRCYLEEHRLTTLEKRIDADLALGGHHEVINEIAALVSQNPGNERLLRQYRVAADRCAADGKPVSRLASVHAIAEGAARRRSRARNPRRPF